MLQTYILVDNGLKPHENAQYGKSDSSVCGNCPHRASPEAKTGSCYVNLGQGPFIVYQQYLAGKYPMLDNTYRELFKDRNLRMGSYGDPAAIPYKIWAKMRSWCSGHTAYTHQWRTCDQKFSKLCMASCDTPQDYIDAKKKGWRTFRVKSEFDPILNGEIACPASKERNYSKQCAGCLACNGSKKKTDLRRDIVINAHGLKHKIDKFNVAKSRLLSLTIL